MLGTPHCQPASPTPTTLFTSIQHIHTKEDTKEYLHILSGKKQNRDVAVPSKHTERKTHGYIPVVQYPLHILKS
jgi:hypothetical protein